MNEKYSFEFSVFELNSILKGLQELPFKESSKLIEFIQVEYEKQAKERDLANKEKAKKERQEQAKKLSEAKK